MIIDFHTHIFPPGVEQRRAEYIQHDPLFAQLYSDPRAVLAGAEQLIANMDLQSIDKSVVLNIAWQSEETCRDTNRYILESTARYPQRLIGFGMVRLDDPASALPEIEFLARSGIKGIGEVRPSTRWLTQPDTIRPVIESIVAHGLMLLAHSSEPVGHLYPGKGELTPESLYPFIAAFPDLKLVCAHWGGGLPFYALMPEVKKALKNVYFDCAASPYLYRPEVYPLSLKLVGAERILFGSDFPLLKPARLLKEIQSQELDEAARALILGRNAARLLGIEEG